MKMVESTTDERAVISVVEAGRRLGLSKNSAYEAVARGEIPALRFGRRLVVPKAALERMLAEAGRDAAQGAAR